jgi:hypothetical protein
MELLIKDYGEADAPMKFAEGLSRGNAESLKLGYSPENSILAMKEIFPEVSEERAELIRANIQEQIEEGRFYAPLDPAPGDEIV